MNNKAIVLGCGLVGATMVRDLAEDPDFEVTAADISEETLRKVGSLLRVATKPMDLADPSRVRAVVQDHDIVLGALPSRLGFQTLEAVIESGKPYCDISFMPEDALQLDATAKTHGVAAVVDCGVSPGLSNLVVGYAYSQLDRVDRAVIYVGGLPKVRRWPYEYKAPFAPSDVLELYTRPARVMESGKLVERPALLEPELIDFPSVGTLEAFNTDGLRTLLTTVDIPDMKEKTLRYPGHCALMRALRDGGFFDLDQIDVKGVLVRPLDVTSRLLFTKWTLEEGEEEFTVMRVVVEGCKGDTLVRHTYEMYDEYDRKSGTSSMARTTGFPCTIIARMLARGEIDEAGIFPLELLARRQGLFDHVLNELSARGVNISERVEELP